MNLKLIKQLETKIDKADELYHSFGDSGIDDAEYDSWKDTLKNLDPTNKRFKTVGAKATKTTSSIKEHWEKFEHIDYKMGSQNKVTNESGLIKWASNVDDSSGFGIEHKLDGTSVKIIYENGKLVAAATRGDGEKGENVTRNVRKMSGIPSTISYKDKLIIRGEILLFKSKLHLIGGKNTRNSAAGTAKRLDGVGVEHLNVKIYNIMNWQDVGVNTNAEVIAVLNNLGFDTVDFHYAKTIADVQKVMENYETTLRKTLDWDIDGLIITTNTLRNDAWDFPKYSIAYKFKSEQSVTKLLDVVWNDTGGRISPKAILEPVDINGVTVSAATLNNYQYIKDLGIKIGDMVLTSRRNDVIPCIEKVSIPDPNGKEIVPPTHDEDGYPIVFETNSAGEKLVYLVSTNPNSKSKIKRKILSWYKCHDAKGIGEETISDIIDNGLATDLPSFYDLMLNGSEELSLLEGFGAGKFKIFNKATLLTSKTDIITFMDALDLQGFGRSRFESIIEKNNTKIDIKTFINLCKDEKFLINIPGFSDNTISALKEALKEAETTITAILSRVTVAEWEPTKAVASSINGLSFCFTGSMENDRSDLEKAVKKFGGIISGVNKNLDYLVVSDLSWTSTKVDKADKLGIKKITEKQFLTLIGGSI